MATTLDGQLLLQLQLLIKWLAMPRIDDIFYGIAARSGRELLLHFRRLSGKLVNVCIELHLAACSTYTYVDPLLVSRIGNPNTCVQSGTHVPT